MGKISKFFIINLSREYIDLFISTQEKSSMKTLSPAKDTGYSIYRLRVDRKKIKQAKTKARI